MDTRIINSFTTFTQVIFDTRKINRHQECVSRKDSSYDQLVRNFYYWDSSQKQKLFLFAKLLEKYQDTSCLSKASYIYAIHYKWDDAIELMRQVIVLEKGENIDSWTDFAFFLRKIPRYRNISIQLLLWLEETIDNYKWEKDIIAFLQTAQKS